MRLSTILNALAWPWVALHYKTRNFRIFLRARLPRKASVLEIGPGHNPWFRSNVLCERFLFDDTERCGPLKRDGRPLIEGDACALPFADQSFDFVFCSHIMEHIENLEAFLAEIQRVGRAGYLETPNALFEQSVGTTTHKWAFWVDDSGVLNAEPKWVAGAPERTYHGMHRAINRNPFFGLAMILTPELRVMELFWKGRIPVRIHPTPTPLEETRARA